MVSSRDRKFVSVEMVALPDQVRPREPSPGHRRLRFSFQFNDVKDRTDHETGPPMRSAAAGAAIYGDAEPLSTDPLGRLFPIRHSLMGRT